MVVFEATKEYAASFFFAYWTWVPMTSAIVVARLIELVFGAILLALVFFGLYVIWRGRRPETSVRLEEPQVPLNIQDAQPGRPDPVPRAKHTSPKPDPPPRPEDLDRKAARRLLRHESPREREIGADRLAKIGRRSDIRPLLAALAVSRKAGERHRRAWEKSAPSGDLFGPSRGERAETEVQIKIVDALGAVGDERCLSPIFDCVPLHSSFLHPGAPPLERAGGPFLRALRRSPKAGRKWLAKVQKMRRPGTKVTLAKAAAMLGAPNAVDAIAEALSHANDWEKVSLVSFAADIDDPRAVSVILGQVRRGCYKGGHDLEKSLEDIVERLRTTLPVDLLREVAQALPFSSQPLSASPIPGGPVFLDGVRRAALDELERRGEELASFAERPDGQGLAAEEVSTYRRLLSRLTAASEKERSTRMDGSRGLDDQTDALEAEMLALLEQKGDAIPLALSCQS
jgi:hypothetical protein